MSERLPSREQAIKLLIEKGCPANVVKHCVEVSTLAVETAETLKKKGYSIDAHLVEIGALMHDLGRSKTHGVNHVVEGANIAESIGMPKPVVNIIRRHMGGGITPKEAETLGWPRSDGYVPLTLEEKVVSYADKLIDGGRRVPIELTMRQFHGKGLHEAAERIKKLHNEIATLIEDCP